MTESKKYKSTKYRQIILGALELTILSDGYIVQTPVHPILAPLATAEEVKLILEENFRPLDHMDSALNILVVKSAERLILIDSGLGIFGEANQGWLIESLKEAGFDTGYFTDVLISHAHVDHIGGLVDKEDNLVFRNAKIHISKVEYDFWQSATIEDFKEGPLYGMKEFVEQTITRVQSILNRVQPNLHFIDFEKRMYGIFSFELAAGHTPGHSLIKIESEGDALMCIVDLVAADIILFEHPDWGFIGDFNIQEAAATRIRVLKALSDSKRKAFAFHLPYPGLGFVRQKANAFEWVPEVFATP